MRKHLEQITEEMKVLAKDYKEAEEKHVKDHYDSYIRIMVLNQFPRDLQDDYLKLWEKMKG